MTLVVVEAVLLARFRSASLPETVAVLLAGPGSVRITTIVTLADAPTARLPTAQVTMPDAWVQAPWVEDAEKKVTPAGSGSVTVTPVAGPGPALATLIVNGRPSPSQTR